MNSSTFFRLSGLVLPSDLSCTERRKHHSLIYHHSPIRPTYLLHFLLHSYTSFLDQTSLNRLINQIITFFYSKNTKFWITFVTVFIFYEATTFQFVLHFLCLKMFINYILPLISYNNIVYYYYPFLLIQTILSINTILAVDILFFMISLQY